MWDFFRTFAAFYHKGKGRRGIGDGNDSEESMEYTRQYKSLDVYIVARQLVLSVYKLLQIFPSEERYALCDQLRRAVISVPSNVAEGLGRGSEKEQVRFLEIAYGSLMEVETQLEIALDLKYISEEELNSTMELIDREARLLSGLRARRISRNP